MSAQWITTHILKEGAYNFVRGSRTFPTNGKRYINKLNPATGKLLCRVGVSDIDDVNIAVTNAAEAFRIWSQWSPVDRGRVLLKVAGLIRDNANSLAVLECMDTGKPIWEAQCDILSCAQAFEYFGGIIPSFLGDHIPLSSGSFAHVAREPLGVVAGIGAWNFPLQTCSWKVAPALACGNAVIYKPSEFSPITSPILGEIVSKAGGPAGLLTILQGDGETGKLLSEHSGIVKVSFTGSGATGRKILRAAETNLKHVTLELGGKSPLLVFPDASIKNAVKGAMMANFLSQGEVCSNGTRVFVHEDIYDEFLMLLTSKVSQMVVGDPLNMKTTVGACIHKEHAERVMEYINSAIKEGATLHYGGDRVGLPTPFEEGYFLRPCILTECTDDMKVVQEEIFGAVMCLLKFKTEEEVLRRANDTVYGLAAGVFTRDIQRGHRVARELQAGVVWINNYNLYPTEIPFGGYKESGVGRENGLEVLRHYTQAKTVYVEAGDVDAGPLFCD